MSWRTGSKYGFNVYDMDRPVATFRNASDAAIAVAAVNDTARNSTSHAPSCVVTNGCPHCGNAGLVIEYRTTPSSGEVLEPYPGLRFRARETRDLKVSCEMCRWSVQYVGLRS